jgi:arabinofuranan 3-O-arabinosyltransferase
VSAPVLGGRATVALPYGETSRIRVTITGVAGGARGGAVGVRELTVPGIRVRQAVAYPPDDASAPQWSVLAERPDGRRGDCVLGTAGWTCVPGLAEAGEEDGPLVRRFDAPSGSIGLTATVRPRPGPALNALLDRAGGYRATGSSALVPDPAARPGAAYDRDPATAWLPAVGDPNPQLSLSLGSMVTLSGLTVADWSGVGSVDLTTADGRRRTATGTGSFAPLRTDQVTLTFRRQLGPYGRPVPVSVRDLAFRGGPAPASRRVDVACGSGPALDLDGKLRPLAMSVGAADLLSLAPVPALVCGGRVAVTTGPHRLATTATAALEVSGAAMASGALPTAPAGRPVTVQSWSDEHRTVRIAGGAKGYLALAEGYNRGWRATADGVPLEAKRMDGWQQGFEVPAGPATTVVLTFAPAGTQHRMLLAGLLAALVVLLLAALPGGRVLPRTAPPPGAIPLGRWVPAGPVAVLGVLLVGPVGLAAAAAALALPRRRRPLAAGGALALAGVLLAADPGARWVQAAGQGLAAVALCLVTAALAGWRPPGEEEVGEPQRRPLDQHPREPAERDGPEPGQHRDRQHPPAEVGPAGEPVDGVEDDEVPEKNTIGDAPQQPQRL